MDTAEYTFNRRNYFLAMRLLAEINREIFQVTKEDLEQVVTEMNRIISVYPEEVV